MEHHAPGIQLFKSSSVKATERLVTGTRQVGIQQSKPSSDIGNNRETFTRTRQATGRSRATSTGTASQSNHNQTTFRHENLQSSIFADHLDSNPPLFFILRKRSKIVQCIYFWSGLLAIILAPPSPERTVPKRDSRRWTRVCRGWSATKVSRNLLLE